MKNLRLLSLIAISLVSATFFSCKKTVSPKLKVTVQDAANNTVRNALVKVDARGYEPARISEEFDQEELTDEHGNAYFDFKNTVLVTVIANAGLKTDTAYVLLETKRTRDDENLYTKSLTVR